MVFELAVIPGVIACRRLSVLPLKENLCRFDFDDKARTSSFTAQIFWGCWAMRMYIFTARYILGHGHDISCATNVFNIQYCAAGLLCGKIVMSLVGLRSRHLRFPYSLLGVDLLRVIDGLWISYQGVQGGSSRSSSPRRRYVRHDSLRFPHVLCFLPIPCELRRSPIIWKHSRTNTYIYEMQAATSRLPAKSTFSAPWIFFFHLNAYIRVCPFFHNLRSRNQPGLRR